MDAKEYLQGIMGKYTVDNLVIPKDEFKEKIEEFLHMKGDSAYTEEEKDIQRTQSLDFIWGHNHDFGEFNLAGTMGDRHIEIIAKFISLYELPRDLSGKRVLDVGVWCGGTSLLLAGMGAKVYGIEEVGMYADCAHYLCKSFGTDSAVFHTSVYSEQYEGTAYDHIVFPGVLYHLTDPILALRILFNLLKDGGELYIETMTTDLGPGAAIEYYGSNTGGWNWFAPNQHALDDMLRDVGFEEMDAPHIENNRLVTRAVRKEWKPMVKAGLSRNIR